MPIPSSIILLKQIVTTKNLLKNLPSLFDLDIFKLNTRTDKNANCENDLLGSLIRCNYYSPHNFQKQKLKFWDNIDRGISLLHSNVSSLKKILKDSKLIYLRKFHIHLM